MQGTSWSLKPIPLKQEMGTWKNLCAQEPPKALLGLSWNQKFGDRFPKSYYLTILYLGILTLNVAFYNTCLRTNHQGVQFL